VADRRGPHDGHDPVVITRLLDRDIAADERAAAESLIASCPSCAALHADLLALATATRAQPTPAAHRSFTLSADDAARLAVQGNGEPGGAMPRLSGVMTDPSPASDHASHDTILVSSLADRLARYYEVENTYLASFQWLGALAAALSTLTLVAVAARSVFERRAEWFVLRAAGYSPRNLRAIVASEIAALALASVSFGGLAAALALLPLPRASHPAAALTLLFPALCLLSTVAATLGAFRMLDDPRVSRPAIG